MLADRLGHEKVSTTLNTYSHLFPHKQQELVHSPESLQATDSPTPEPPSDNPLLEAAGITCEVPQTQSNGSDVTIRPQFGPALVPSNTASGKKSSRCHSERSYSRNPAVIRVSCY